MEVPAINQELEHPQKVQRTTNEGINIETQSMLAMTAIQSHHPQ